MSSEPSSRDVDRILSYLRERDERTADWRARVEAQLTDLSKQVGEIDDARRTVVVIRVRNRKDAY